VVKHFKNFKGENSFSITNECPKTLSYFRISHAVKPTVCKDMQFSFCLLGRLVITRTVNEYPGHWSPTV